MVLLMNKNYILLSVLFIFLSINFAHSADSQNVIKENNNENKIVMFGSNRCGWTKLYRDEFNGFGIKYEFNDVNSRAMEDKMWATLAALNYNSNAVDYPLIIHHGVALTRPDLISFIKNNFPEKISIFSQLKPIEVYSQKNDNNTKKYLDQLGKLEIEFLFKDINLPENNRFFFKKAEALGLGNRVRLPAIIINGKVIIAPTLSQTIDLLRNS